MPDVFFRTQRSVAINVSVAEVITPMLVHLLTVNDVCTALFVGARIYVVKVEQSDIIEGRTVIIEVKVAGDLGIEDAQRRIDFIAEIVFDADGFCVTCLGLEAVTALPTLISIRDQAVA